MVLSGLDAQESSLYIWDTSAPVFVQDSRFRYSQDEIITFECYGNKGRSAVDVRDSERVALVGCELEGGPGDSTFEFSGCPGGEGGDGLRCVNSVVAVYDSELYGGAGGNAKADPGDGGPGINATISLGGSSTVFASNCLTKGGAGGQNALFPQFQGCGGAGTEVHFNSLLIHLETTFTSGDSNNCQEPALRLAGGAATDLQDTHRGFLAPTFAPAASIITTGFYGQPGDVVWVFLSTGEKFRLFDFGVLHLPVFTPLPAAAGVVPASGELLVPVDLSTVPPSVDPQVVTLQGFALGATGTRRLTRPRQLLVIDPASGPDCNSNGNNDYLDILGGLSADANFNLIPDECPGG